MKIHLYVKLTGEMDKTRYWITKPLHLKLETFEGSGENEVYNEKQPLTECHAENDFKYLK